MGEVEFVVCGVLSGFWLLLLYRGCVVLGWVWVVFVFVFLRRSWVVMVGVRKNFVKYFYCYFDYSFFVFVFEFLVFILLFV